MGYLHNGDDLRLSDVWTGTDCTDGIEYAGVEIGGREFFNHTAFLQEAEQVR